MPTRHFLNSSAPLGEQAAEFVTQLSQAEGIDSSEILLITPTSGASRTIIRSIRATGHKAPKSTQPMQALLREGADIAQPFERCLAWAEALSKAPQRLTKALFWKRPPESTAEKLKAGRNLNRVCDLLIEGGHTPETLTIPQSIHGTFEEQRWDAIGQIYRDYRGSLSAWGLTDPNELRLRIAKTPENSNLRQVVIACVPDLPKLFEIYIESLRTGQVGTQILIWNPSDAPHADFDDFGRPIPEVWTEKKIPIAEESIHVAATAQDEAHQIAQRAIDESSQIVLVDPKQSSLVSSRVRRGGRIPYLPNGEPLIRCEAARIALGWAAFSTNQDLRRLRTLLESPSFCRALDPQQQISQTDAFVAIDHLLGKTIASELEGAWAASPPTKETDSSRVRDLRKKVRRLLGTVRKLVGISPASLLLRAYPDKEQRHESANRVLALCIEIENSPASENYSDDSARIQILEQAIRSESIVEPATEDVIRLNGWLEAPWLNSTSLSLGGLIEGKLPQSVEGDPFLPDSIRPELGIGSNAQRLARDTYLMANLVARYPEGRLHASLSKYNRDGDPNRASRLLFRAEDGELPQRTLHLTEAQARTQTRPKRKTGWRWKFDGPVPKVAKISPTQFDSYLACPTRFFFEKVMNYEAGPVAAREMDASVFGNLIHKTLEHFGTEAISLGERMLELDERSIRKSVQSLLAAEVVEQFGPHPTPAVRIQVANAEARLNAFARIQADCFQQGWLIRDVERKISAEDPTPLKIGPLPLSGIIDRIEQHKETGALRIMDFKTFSSLKKPAETHLGPSSHNWLPEALVDLQLGTRLRQKTWKNLQLPIYRKILEHWYPNETQQNRPETAYFILPSDPSDTGVYPFIELDEAMNPDAYASAIKCAEAAAIGIAQGVFWPPQEFRSPWEDPLKPILVNGPAEESIHPDTINQLRGGVS